MFTPKKIGAGAGRAAQYYAENFHKEDYPSTSVKPLPQRSRWEI